MLERLCKILTANKMQLTFHLGKKQMMLCLSSEACKKSIMLKTNVYVYCGHKESLSQNTKESVGMDNGGEDEYQEFWLDKSRICMREQRQGPEWILRCCRSYRLKWGYTKHLCCHLLFAIEVDVINEMATQGVLSELMYVDNLVLMSQAINGFENKF